LVFLYHFDALISKIIFKKYKNYYFNIFLSKKYFKKQQQPYFKNNFKWNIKLRAIDFNLWHVDGAVSFTIKSYY
jgi:hypothetical protein